MDIITNNIINNLIVLIYYIENQDVNFNDFVDIFILNGIEIPNNTVNINLYIDNLINKIRLFFNEYVPSLKSTRYNYIKNNLNDKYFNRLQLYEIYKNKVISFKTKWKELIRYKYKTIIQNTNLDDLNYDNLFKNTLKDKTKLEIVNLIDIEILRLKNNFKSFFYELSYDKEISNYYNLKKYQYENQLRILNITDYNIYELNYIEKLEEYEILIDNEIENFKQIIINNIPSIYDLNTLDINIIKYIRRTYIYNNTQKNNLINQIKYYDDIRLYSEYFKDNFINLNTTLDNIAIRKKNINLDIPLNSTIIKNYKKSNNIFKLTECSMLDNFLTDFNKDHINISDTLEYYLSLEDIILTTENYYNFKKYLYNISQVITIDTSNLITFKNSLKNYIFNAYNGINYQNILDIDTLIINKTNLKYRNYLNIALEGKTLIQIQTESSYYYNNLLNRYLLLLEEEFKNNDIISYIKKIRNNDKYNISKELNSNLSKRIFIFLGIKLEDDYFKKLEFII